MTKKSDSAHDAKKAQSRVPTNLALLRGVKTRGKSVARQMGYDLSNLVETILQRIYEAHKKHGPIKPGEILQVEIPDVRPDPELEKDLEKQKENGARW